MRTIGSYEAKTKLSHLLDEVVQGEEFTITKHGVPVAVLCAPASAKPRVPVASMLDEMRRFRGKHPLRGLAVKTLIQEGRKR